MRNVQNFYSRLLLVAALGGPLGALPCQNPLKHLLATLNQGFHDASPEVFAAALAKHADPLFLKERSVEELSQIVKQGGELFLSEAGNVGFGLTSEHELISLFNGSGLNGMGAKAVEVAKIRGLKFLHCLEPLRAYYEGLGFVVAERTEIPRWIPGRARLWAESGQAVPSRFEDGLP